MAYFSDAFLRKASSILARFADSSKWGGDLGYFVLHVAVAPAEPSLRGRMDEQDGLVVIVRLKVQLKSEVPGLGGREEKQTATVPAAARRALAIKAARSDERDLL